VPYVSKTQKIISSNRSTKFILGIKKLPIPKRHDNRGRQIRKDEN